MHAIVTYYMLLLYYIPVIMVIMYRGVFTVGIALIGIMAGDSNAINSANVYGDYSYVNARDGSLTSGVQIARCVTGLGPSATDTDNRAVGGVYFDGSRLAFESCSDSSSRLVHPRAAGFNNLVGVINIIQCDTPFTAALEGVYTCTMMNSSMIEESIRFGVYFTGRSK